MQVFVQAQAVFVWFPNHAMSDMATDVLAAVIITVIMIVVIMIVGADVTLLRGHHRIGNPILNLIRGPPIQIQGRVTRLRVTRRRVIQTHLRATYLRFA